MKQNWPKMIVVLAVLIAGVFMASSAMAINLTCRSEEMTAFSECDLAGTMTLAFTQSDYNAIRAYLGTGDPNADGIDAGTGTANAVIIRVSLSGTDIAPTSDVPLLCAGISGTASSSGAAVPLASLPNSSDLVALQTIDVEVSDLTNGTGGVGAAADAIADVTGFVYGVSGSQYFTIYITDLQPAQDWADENQLPWIKVGIYQELLDAADNEDTSICAKVEDFGGLSKLTISLDLTPEALTYTTGDNQIGHFLVEEVEIRDCVKAEDCVNDTTATVQLCEREEAAGQAVLCPDYYACFVIEGDIPISGAGTLEIRSNGATDGANTQSGVYITDVKIYDEDGTEIVPTTAFTYWQADGTTTATIADCDDESEQAWAIFDLADIAAVGDELRVCITYQINPEEATVDTDVNFWAYLYMPPCGTIVSGTHTAATLVECGAVPTCMYYPYVLTQLSPWQCGLVVTNLSAGVAPEDMVVTFTLTDSTGTAYTYTKSDFTSTVWAAYLDSYLSEFSGTPALGAAWLLVSANFTMDGYEFLTDGVFGAGTLPRLLTACGVYVGADATR